MIMMVDDNDGGDNDGGDNDGGDCINNRHLFCLRHTCFEHVVLS